MGKALTKQISLSEPLTSMCAFDARSMMPEVGLLTDIREASLEGKQSKAPGR